MNTNPVSSRSPQAPQTPIPSPKPAQTVAQYALSQNSTPPASPPKSSKFNNIVTYLASTRLVQWAMLSKVNIQEQEKVIPPQIRESIKELAPKLAEFLANLPPDPSLMPKDFQVHEFSAALRSENGIDKIESVL